MLMNSMKTLFIMRYPLDKDYHLKMKFNGQMAAFVNMGFDVDYIAYDKKNVYKVNFATQNKEILGKTHFNTSSKYRSTFGFYDLYHALYKLAKTQQYDYAYMRNKAINGTAIKAIQLLKSKGCKIIVEIPSYGSTEKELSTARIYIRKMINYWGKQLPELVDLYTLIGLDGGGYYLNRPALNIRNGISVEQVPVKKNTKNNSVHILALATMRIWHAYDRLIEGLATYNGKYDFVIDMVGRDADGSLQAWMELAEKRGVANKVVCHGPLFGEELTKIFDTCEIAVATLGFHRNNLSCGSTLKIREYTARGIPFIYGYRDESLTGDETFALRLPATDEPVDMMKVEEWLTSIRKVEDITKVMRDYAQKKMSWESEFKKVISFVDSL